MSHDPGLNAALCALTQLTDQQLDGLDALAAMSDYEVDVFGAQVEDAWDANVQAVQDARAAVDVAMLHRLEVETECGNAARARQMATGGQGPPRLTAEEKARCWAARDEWLAAKDAAAEAQQRFKDGVTADQLAEAG